MNKLCTKKWLIKLITKTKKKMKTFHNKVIINGIEYTNSIEASTYAEALKIQKSRKQKSKYKFKGRLTLA